MRVTTIVDKWSGTDIQFHRYASTVIFDFDMYSKSSLEKKLFEVMTIKNCADWGC